MNVLFVGAHPDDIETYCGGTAAHYAEQGRQRGGQVGKTRTLAPEEISVDFQTTEDVTHLLGRVCQWVLTGQVDPKVGNCVVYAASAALRSLDQGEIEVGLKTLRLEVDALKRQRGAA
jgi:hypothetical protein